jgi:hypothetical protein
MTSRYKIMLKSFVSLPAVNFYNLITELVGVESTTSYRNKSLD